MATIIDLPVKKNTALPTALPVLRLVIPLATRDTKKPGKPA